MSFYFYFCFSSSFWRQFSTSASTTPLRQVFLELEISAVSTEDDVDFDADADEVDDDEEDGDDVRLLTMDELSAASD